MVGSIVRLKFNGLGISVETTLNHRSLLGGRLCGRCLHVRLGQLRVDHMLLGVHFGCLLEIVDGSVPILGFHGFHAAIEGVIEGLVFLHLLRTVFDRLLDLRLLFRRHFAGLFGG